MKLNTVINTERVILVLGLLQSIFLLAAVFAPRYILDAQARAGVTFFLYGVTAGLLVAMTVIIHIAAK